MKLIGKRGRGDNELSMPVNVIVDDCKEQEHVYILDPGNSRIKCLTLDGKFIRHLGRQSNFLITIVRISFVRHKILL